MDQRGPVSVKRDGTHSQHRNIIKCETEFRSAPSSGTVSSENLRRHVKIEKSVRSEEMASSTSKLPPGNVNSCM